MPGTLAWTLRQFQASRNGISAIKICQDGPERAHQPTRPRMCRRSHHHTNSRLVRSIRTWGPVRVALGGCRRLNGQSLVPALQAGKEVSPSASQLARCRRFVRQDPDVSGPHRPDAATQMYMCSELVSSPRIVTIYSQQYNPQALSMAVGKITRSR